MLNNDFIRRQNLNKLRGGDLNPPENVPNQLRNLNNNFNPQPFSNNESEDQNIEQDNNTDIPIDTMPSEPIDTEDLEEEKDSYY